MRAYNRCTARLIPRSWLQGTRLIDLPPACRARDLRNSLLGDRRDVRAESSILELVEIANGVANAAAVREIADSSAVRTSDRSWLPAASCTASGARDSSKEPGCYGLGGLDQPGRRRSSILWNCCANSSQWHGSSASTSDQNWSVLC